MQLDERLSRTPKRWKPAVTWQGGYLFSWVTNHNDTSLERRDHHGNDAVARVLDIGEIVQPMVWFRRNSPGMHGTGPQLDCKPATEMHSAALSLDTTAGARINP